MPVTTGTRARQDVRKETIDQGAPTRFLTRDLGMTKNFTGSCTFSTAGTISATSIDGSFAAGDDIMVGDVNLNNGFFNILSTSSGVLTVYPNPKNEGPITATVRSP